MASLRTSLYQSGGGVRGGCSREAVQGGRVLQQGLSGAALEARA